MLECALAEGAWDRSERMKKRQRRGPATATCTSLLCSRTQQYQYQQLRKHYQLSHLVLAASIFHGCLEYCCRVRTTCTLVYFCLSNGTTQLNSTLCAVLALGRPRDQVGTKRCHRNSGTNFEARQGKATSTCSVSTSECNGSEESLRYRKSDDLTSCVSESSRDK